MILAALLAACTKDPLTQPGGKTQEGLPARVNLAFNVAESQVETRVAQPTENERGVRNLYVFIFTPAGEVHLRQFETLSQAADKGVLTFDTESLNDAQIVCVANLTTEGVHSSYEVTKETLDAIQSLDELKQLEMKLQEKTVERSSQFMMTGYAYDNNNPNSTTVTIPGREGGETATLECTLRPERTDAKIEFVVKTEIPTDKADKWSDFDFTPRTWRVVNVPAQSMLLPKETGDADGDQCEYFSTDPLPFETEERDENYKFQKGGFVFYMPENRKTPAQTISGDGLTDEQLYALREERNHKNEDKDFSNRPGQEYENGAFTYAPENSTYVEMSGTLSYKDGQDYTVNADITFTVHLGYANHDPNDYETRRNTHYTYTVTLRGVDNIITEVTSEADEEPRPGYTGEVVYNQEGLYEVDAHYGRELITIDRSMVLNLQWGIQTPFGKSIYSGDFSDSETPESQQIYDYKWIKFAVNADYGETTGSLYVKYPGDQNYKGGKNETSPYYASSHPDARLLDVHQLLKRLKEEYAEGQISGRVAVTAFIDEYVYVQHPKDGTEYLSKWRTYVEAEDRLLYFVDAANAKYSPDGESDVIKAVQTFKQKSIRTVYNTKKSESELPTAWGLESDMEGTRWAPGDVTHGEESSNGRKNTVLCLLDGNENNQNLHWTDVMNTSVQYGLNQWYEDALHAVLMRNRDLDGDNIVDADEIRWYLAARDQLVDLYIGEAALDEASRLYPSNPADRENRVKWHYTTSSCEKDDEGNATNTPWVLWAEECVALGSYGSSSDIMDRRYAYRCIRNLGIELASLDQEPTPLIPKVTAAESDGTYLIDVTNLSEKARRTSFEAGSLPTHDDESPYNRPYGKFRVAPSDADYNVELNTPILDTYWDWGAAERKTYFTNESNWSQYKTVTLPYGYRLPNLRELLIMQTRLPDDAWTLYSTRYLGRTYESKAMYMSYTSFSRAGTLELEHKNGGFRFNAQDKSIGATESGNDGGYARGVKDVQY